MLKNVKLVSQSPAFFARLFAMAILAIALTSQNRISAQTATNIALKGTYATSVTDGVDIFSGKLEQVFPLISIQGRGEISQGLYLPLRNSDWKMVHEYTVNGNDRFYTFDRAVQGNFVDNFARAGYSTLGKLEVQTRYPGSYITASATVTTIKFTSSSGSITEFRDALTNGQPFEASRGCSQLITQPTTPPPACSRGRAFRATNGSNALFVADADIYDIVYIDVTGQPTSSYTNQDNISGTIFLSDGTRMRVEGNFNNITKITDRNGNYMTMEYVTAGYDLNFLKKITDSLNREITIDYGDATQPSYFDEIVYKGFGGAEKRIRINYAPVETVMLAGQALGVPLFPEVHPRCYINATSAPCDPTPAGPDPSGPSRAVSLVVPTSIVLPNGTQYGFYYNEYLEVARIQYPTGSYSDYNYTGVTGAAADGFIESPPSGGAIYRRIGSIRNFDASGQLINEKTFSNIPQLNTTGFVDNVTTDVKDSSGTVLTKTRHYYYNFPGMEILYPYVPMTYAREYRTEALDPVTEAVLRRTEITIEQRAPFQWCSEQDIFAFYYCDSSTDPTAGPANDPRITEVKTTLETGQVTTERYSFDQYNNITDTYEYDYGNGQPGQFLRRKHTDYVTDPNYTSTSASYLLRLPLHGWVSSDLDGNNKTSFTQYEYDNYSNDTNHASLAPRDNVSGFDVNYGTSYTRRGNSTAVTRFTDAQNQTGPVTTYSQFDILGNVVKTIDGRGVTGTFDYSDRFGGPNGDARGNWDSVSKPSQLSGLNTFASLTETTNALGQTSYTQFDYSTGLAVDAEDINGNVTTSFYLDPLDRVTQVITANNRPSLRSQKTIAYDDVNRTVTTTADLHTFGDNLTKTEGLYNSLGQTTETRRYETDGYIASRSEYDALGRVVATSNPFRPYLNESPVWTTTGYDPLDRVVSVQNADGSQAFKNYTGNVTTVTDQAQRQRRSMTDALGQLVRVDEPNGQNNLGTIDSPAQPTFYNYNTNGELVKVTQGDQSRIFLYDSLGRLIRVRQSEQDTNASLDMADSITGNSHWSTGATYDANGNALTTTDANGVVITHTYDALNRILSCSYSDSTPGVTYTYENPNIGFSNGRLTKISSNVSITEYTSFDAIGRTLTHRQTTDGQVYTTAYTYDLSGRLVEETYPSGRVVKNTYNEDARLAEVSSKSAGQSAFQIYADSFAYTAAESVYQMRLGNGDWETTQFNSRLQVSQISLGSSQNSDNLWRVNYDYGEIDNNGSLQADKNSGNVARQTINFTGLGQPFVQTYKYDELNRLIKATETNGSTQTWDQSLGYDRYGNRTSINQQKLGEQSVTQTPSIAASSNRFAPGQGFVYDLNGNLTQDDLGRQFTFNGDNRQVEVRDASYNVIGLYYYDGKGQRVKKITASETTIYVYSASGKLLAEYSTQQSGNSTSYLTADKLGSPRVITNAAGGVVSHRDFMPFGEEIFAGTANRAPADKFGYGIDNVRKRFTGYEKDAETGLDFAEARYYDNRYGRFTAVDPLLASGISADAQSFNRYAYVMNNPVTATDPTGMFSDSDWYTMDGGLFGGFQEPPSIELPIPYEEYVKTYARQQRTQTQQPAPRDTRPPAGPPPIDSSLEGSPTYAARHPLIIGVQIYAPTPKFVPNHYYNEKYHTGIESIAIVTFVDAKGVPVDERLFVKEQVEGKTVVNGYTISNDVVQNTKGGMTDNGFPDVIGILTETSAPLPQPNINLRQTALATNEVRSPSTQTYTVITPRGQYITVTDTRLLSNAPAYRKDENNLYIPEYSVSVDVTSFNSNFVGGP
jgi:RHS repeat-associated protein